MSLSNVISDNSNQIPQTQVLKTKNEMKPVEVNGANNNGVVVQPQQQQQQQQPPMTVDNIQNVQITSNKASTQFTFTINNWSQRNKPFYSESYTLWDLTWKIYVFPTGNGNNSDQLSLFLDLQEARNQSIPGIRVIFTLEVVNQKNPLESVKKSADRILNHRNCDWGFNSFLPLVQLNSPTAGFIKDDKIVVNAEVIQATTLTGNFHYDSKKHTGYVGLQNQGATCYMNSLLQSLYLISPLRRAVYEIPTQYDEPTKSISLALQKLFYKLQFGEKSLPTRELTKSFGWDTHDIFVQHDVQELNRVLCDKINEKMKSTTSEGTIDNLFRGKIKNFIKCENVPYESKSEEYFYDLSLLVKGCKDLLNSFDKYTETEKLDGNNKYFAEGHGFQVANKGVQFLSFPPVLHLHLKRFEYDPEKDDNVKINDKLKFPEILNLNKYLSEEADKSVDYKYHLQGVLVHYGDLHNGHYYAFLKNSDGEWFKFNDDEVTRSNFYLVQENSIGSDLPAGSQRQSNNAYMLIYFRDKEYKQLLKPVVDTEIPTHLKQRIEKDEMKENEQYIEIKLTREEDFYNHFSTDLINLKTFPFRKIKKTADIMTIGHLKKQLTALYGIPMDRQRIWSWVERRNRTIRIEKRPESDDTTLASLERSEGHIKLHLEVSNIQRSVLSPSTNNSTSTSNTGNTNSNSKDSPPQELFLSISSKDSNALIFFKYFDSEEMQLKYMGCKEIDTNSKISSIFPFLNNLMGSPSFNNSWLLYEEITGEKIEPIKPNNTFLNSKIGNGDIIVFQLPTTKFYSKNPVSEYYQDMLNSITVVFKLISHDLQNQLPFKLKLSKLMKYSEITKKIGEHINQNPAYIRLMSNTTSYHDHIISAIKPNDNIPLYDMLSMNQKMTDKLYFEILHIPVLECDRHKNFKILYTHPKSKTQQGISVWVPKQGTVTDLIREFINQTGLFSEQLKRESTQNSDATSESLFSSVQSRVRLMEIKNHRIDRILSDEQVLEIYDYLPLRADIIDDGEYSSLAQQQYHHSANLGSFIQIVHFNRSMGINQYHDYPFLLSTVKGETIQQFRERILSKLGSNIIAAKDFSKWKLACIKSDKLEYLTDETLVLPTIDPNTTFIGLEHPSLPKYNRNKAITING